MRGGGDEEERSVQPCESRRGGGGWNPVREGGGGGERNVKSREIRGRREGCEALWEMKWGERRGM